MALNTSGGAITLQGVSEANVSANSNGGDMDVGKIKAVDAELQTGGGTLSGSVTAGGEGAGLRSRRARVVG